MLDFESLGIKSPNQLNPCAVPSDAVKIEAKNSTIGIHWGEWGTLGFWMCRASKEEEDVRGEKIMAGAKCGKWRVYSWHGVWYKDPASSGSHIFNDMGGQAQRSNFYSAATRGQGRWDEAEAENKAWVRVWYLVPPSPKGNHTNSQQPHKQFRNSISLGGG